MPTIISRKWNSLSEFVDYANGDTDMVEYRRHSRRNVSGFHSCESFEAASEIAFNWPEGVARIEGIRARIALKSQRLRKRAVAREVGPGVVSMGRFVAGHPQPYIALEDSDEARPGKGKVVHILLNACVSAGVDREVIETRGAAVLALAAALEQSGRRVEIVVGMANAGRRGKGERYMDYRVTVKNAARKLNLNSVAFAIANPDMLRRFIFSAMERESAEDRARFKVPGGYGSVIEFRDRPDNCVYIGGALYGEAQWSSDEAAAAWVTRSLEEQGVKVR